MARISRKNKPTNVAPTVYKTAIYARISRDDTEYESVENQLEICKSYIEQNADFQLIRTFEDNGKTGTNYDRDGFKELLESARFQSGTPRTPSEINCIIVKDLSRFAREYIDINDYIYSIFPFLGVRFIALGDNFDSNNFSADDFLNVSFKSIANSLFAKETSEKAVKSKRALSGTQALCKKKAYI